MPLSDDAVDFGMLFEASPNAYLVLDRRLHIITANRAYLASTNRRLGEIVGRWAWDAFPTDPETLRHSVASFERVIQTGRPDTMPLWRFDIARSPAKGGGFEKRYWSITHTPVLGVDGQVLWVIQHPIDVTELEIQREAVQVAGERRVADIPPAHGIFRRAKDTQDANLALKAESDRLRELFAQAPGFMAIVRGPDHRFELVNEAYTRLFGVEASVDRPAREVLGDGMPALVFEWLDHVFTSGEPFVGRNVELPALTASPTGHGNSIHVDFVLQPIRSRDGKVSGIFVEGSDVTAQHDITEALRQREARLRLVIEGAKDHAILTTDVEGRITSWSSGAAEIFDWPSKEVIGQPFSLIFTSEDRSKGVDARELRVASEKGFATDERWHQRRDGRLVFMNGSVHPLPPALDGTPQGFLKIARDETQRRQNDDALRDLTATLERKVVERTQALEEAQGLLRQSQKLEAIGELASSLSHDLANFLQTIASSFELIDRKVAAGRTDDLGRQVDIGRKTCIRAGALIQRLLAFARKQPLELAVTDVNALVVDMKELMLQAVGDDIQLTLTLQAEPARIRIDKNQLEVALLNLCINARDAMPSGGQLTVRTDNATGAGSEAGWVPSAFGETWFQLSVTDTGTGMTEEVRSKAFDPFFSTKALGKGTGLGLSSTYGFVRQTGGHASIESELGVGTTVRLTWPNSTL